MPQSVPPEAYHLFDEPNFGHLATIMADGSPQSSVIWIDHDGNAVLLNTHAGRVKHRNIQRDPRVSVSVHNRNRPTEYVEVRGTAELSTDGAREHIDALARKYLGEDVDPNRFAGQDRVIIRIAPDRVVYKQPSD